MLFGNFVNSASWEHTLLILNKQEDTFQTRAWLRLLHASVSFSQGSYSKGVTTRWILMAPIVMFPVSSKYLIDWNLIFPLQRDYINTGFCLNAIWVHSHYKYIFLTVTTTYLGEIMASLRLLFPYALGSISTHEGTWAERGKPRVHCFFLFWRAHWKL